MPFLRLFIVFLIALTFAVGFSQLARQSGQWRGDQAATSGCGEQADPCPQWGAARAD